MPEDTCSITKNCVWRAAQRLTMSGRPTQQFDLCIAITQSGEPCGRRATTFFGPLEEWGNPGQPFCAAHASLVSDHVLGRYRPKDVDSSVATEGRGPGPTTGFVYFARRGDRVKIGFTTNPTHRIGALETQGGARFDEVVMERGKRAREQRYHRRFAEHREIGEWFVAVPEIRRVMDRLTALP